MPKESPEEFKLRERTDSEKIQFLMFQDALRTVQEERREEKLDMILSQQEEILVRLRRIDA